MSAYAVFTREKTLDQSELDLYHKTVGATLAGHDVKVLAMYGAFEDLEGNPTEGSVIAEFPSMEAAKAWYDGPEYTEVRKHRQAGSVYRVTLIDGV